MVNTARAVASRQRALAAQVDRQTRAVHRSGGSEQELRKQRITSAKRALQRALHARETATVSWAAADRDAALAARRLIAEGLSISDTTVLCRISRSTLRRLLRVTLKSPDSETSEPSTAVRTGRALLVDGVEGGAEQRIDEAAAGAAEAGDHR
jgi:hypothetical protein